MIKKSLCSNCKTGKEVYELDSCAPVCPYLSFHNGDKCGMYKALKKSENGSRIGCFLKKLTHRK